MGLDDSNLDRVIYSIFDAMGTLTPLPLTPEPEAQWSMAKATRLYAQAGELRDALEGFLLKPRRDAAVALPAFESHSEFPPLSISAGGLVQRTAADWDREAERQKAVQLTFWFFLIVTALLIQEHPELADQLHWLALVGPLAVSWATARKAGQLFDRRYPPEE